ncbi:MAG: beta-mannosidase [Defluviitaleaceae bacterium]|nr:beta-mannosidase [Defluviitaleaceae bacterium]
MKQCLNDGWAVREAPLHYGKEMAGWILNQTDGWYKNQTVPFDVHMPLIEAGIIRDPVISDYCFSSEWIEKRSWWFKKTFDHKKDEQTFFSVKELFIESLDMHADIFLNGVYLGHHASAHFPFRMDVKEFINNGDNILLIRLTTGLEYINDLDISEVNYAVCIEANNGCPERGDMRRAFLRKPTYVFGWDWCPRIGTVAISGNVYINSHQYGAIRHVGIETVSIGKKAVVKTIVEIELLDTLQTADADLSICFSYNGNIAAKAKLNDILIGAGTNYITSEIEINNAEIWWPNGMGDQPLYDVEVVLECMGGTDKYRPFKYGIRTVELDITRMDEKSRRFAVCINGENIFCKGGNWIPADSLYARVTPEKYFALIEEAKEANFNMLRIWGGGIYETDAFFDACDQNGILVWHDFMFACAAYPDHVTDFYDLVAKEIDYQTKRLAARTCIAMLSGNNEMHSMMSGWPNTKEITLKQEKQYGLKIANVQVPEYIKKNCPWVPYWKGSPFGGDSPGSPYVGDVHHWGECMMNGDMEKRIEPREYDKVLSRFVSEYGYPGPCSKETVEKYFDNKPIERYGKVWNLHNNIFEKLTVDAGIKKHYTDRELSFEEYLLYAGLTQSLMLSYSLESLRFKDYCGGGLFWMYNDCWGEVGWTIIDYYLCRKISYYGVKRAFEPIKMIIREDNENPGKLIVLGCNDTVENAVFEMTYGYNGFCGEYIADKKEIIIPARKRIELVVFDKNDRSAENGIWFASASHDKIKPAVFYACEYRKWILPNPVMDYTQYENGTDKIIEINAKTFIHGVYVDMPLSEIIDDNYFDLLPDEKRTVVVKNGAGKHFTVKTVEIK